MRAGAAAGCAVESNRREDARAVCSKSQRTQLPSYCRLDGTLPTHARVEKACSDMTHASAAIKPPLCTLIDKTMVSHRAVSAILQAVCLHIQPANAQSNTAPAPAAAHANDALTPEQAKRALDTLQDDAKRAQMIDTLRAIANTAPEPPAKPGQAAPPDQPPAPKSPIPLTADSLGAQLLLTVSEQDTDISQDVAEVVRSLTHFKAFYWWFVRTAKDPNAYAQLLDIALKQTQKNTNTHTTEWLC